MATTLSARALAPFNLSLVLSRRWIDIAIMLILAAAMATASLRDTSRIPTRLLFDPASNNALFEADTARVVETIATNPGKFGIRYFLHPLISEWLYPITATLSLLPGIDTVDALRLVTALAAALWIAAIYLLLRCIGCARIDATLCALLAGSSAAAVVWFSVPEAHAWASLSVIAALLLAAVSERTPVAPRWHVLVQVLAMSFTITNWLAASIASFVYLRWRRFIVVALVAATFTAWLALTEPILRKLSQQVFPLSPHTSVILTTILGAAGGVMLWQAARRPAMPARMRRMEHLLTRRWMIVLLSLAALLAVIGAMRLESPFIGNAYRGTELQAATAFVFHSFVLPAFTEVDRYGGGWPTLSVQTSLPGTAGAWGLAATVLWAILLACGITAIVRMNRLGRFRAVVAVALACQFVLHLIYGDETFLYALNWLPLLIVLPAMATLTRLRTAVRCIVAAAIVLATVNNIQQFDRAAGRVSAIAAANSMR